MLQNSSVYTLIDVSSLNNNSSFSDAVNALTKDIKTLTGEEAVSFFELIDEIDIKYGVDNIKYILDNLSIEDKVADNNALTILYSGEGEYIQQIRNSDSKVRIIDRTEAAHFLNNDSFEEIINEAIMHDYGKGVDVNDKRNFILYSTNTAEGLWESISNRFVSETKGDVYPLVQHSVPNRICEKVEIPTILDTDSIPITAKINGKTKDINHERY